MITHVEGDYYLGDKQDAEDEAALERHGIDHVVTLASPQVKTTTEYQPLTDGENEQAAFDAAVEAVSRAGGSGGGVLVHCRMGRSRSPTVLATVLAEQHGERFNEALGRIHDTGRFISPHYRLMEHAREYLNEPAYDKQR